MVWRKRSGEAPTSHPHCHPVSLKSRNVFLCRFLALGGITMLVGYTSYLSTSLNAEHLWTPATSPALVPTTLVCSGTRFAEDEGSGPGSTAAPRGWLRAASSPPPSPTFGCQHTHVAAAQLRVTAINYSLVNYRKRKSASVIILILLAVDFSTSAAQGHTGREQTRTVNLSSQPRDVPLPSPLL